jgi:dienelactone hydrolase
MANRVLDQDQPNARRGSGAALATALVLAVLAGCTLPKPPGDGTIRYRDAVFSAVDVTRDVVYGNAPDAQGNPVDLKLDLYLPRGDPVNGRPALIWVHGGGFTAGDKSSGATQATHFARRGYVAVSINYRLLSEDGCGGTTSPPPECEQAAIAAQHDAQAAVRWLRANAATHRVDTDRIAIAGSSAGAVTSLLVDWRAEDPGSSGNPGFSSAIRAAVSISGGAPTNEAIDEDDRPALFFHGSEDRTVPFEWAVSNAAAMHQAGIFTVLEVSQGAGHGLGWTTQIQEQSTYFLYYAMDLTNAQR